jgi:thioredoxin 1
MSESETDADELEKIRQQKREQLEARAGGEKTTEDEAAATAPNEPIHVDGAAELEDLVAEQDVVLVDFYADWCGPCKMLEPTVEALAAETDAAVAKVDIDRNQQLASQYQVRGVPTLLLFSGGDVVEQVVGVRDKSTLANLVQQYS